MFIAAVLLETTEAWISVYSTGQRASSMLLDTVAKFVRSVGEHRITKHNKEELFVRGNPGEMDRRLFSYPSNVKVGFDARASHDSHSRTPI